MEFSRTQNIAEEELPFISIENCWMWAKILIMIFLNTEQQNNPLIISLVIYWNKLKFVDYLLYIRHRNRRRQWHTTSVLLPGKSHGRRSLVGCSSWGREESDMTEWLHFHFSLLSTGEGNGNPLQCSCLENPRDGVTQSWTRLKWLSSSSSRHRNKYHKSIISVYSF